MLFPAAIPAPLRQPLQQRLRRDLPLRPPPARAPGSPGAGDRFHGPGGRPPIHSRSEDAATIRGSRSRTHPTQRPRLPQVPESGYLLVPTLRPDPLGLAERTHRIQVFPFAGHDRAARPIPIGIERRQTLQLDHHGPCLLNRIPARREDLHPPPGNRIPLFPLPAPGIPLPRPVDLDGMAGLHSAPAPARSTRWPPRRCDRWSDSCPVRWNDRAP